jgi:hypothetical protein
MANKPKIHFFRIFILVLVTLGLIYLIHGNSERREVFDQGLTVRGRDSNDRPLAGAIRWDAWTGGAVTREVEMTLGPLKYRDRLPWFAEVTGNSTVRIDGSNQSVMDREIGFAADAGLDYWAFLLYPEPSSMSAALKQYLESSQRHRINFCLIIHNAFGVPDDQWPGELDRALALLGEPGYQTVMDGRPLVYAFEVRYRGSFPAERFAQFRNAARDRGFDPYFVFMGWNPGVEYERERHLGFDAVSAYAYASADTTFKDLARAVEDNYWKNAASAEVPYIPLVTMGWDKQPRRDNPVSWEKGHSYHQQDIFPSVAEPAEIASHLERAIGFVRENRAVCEANAIIIYAWNENDEGGWLSPTLNPDGTANTERLDAIRAVLRPSVVK